MSHNGLFPNPMAFDMALQEPAFYILRRGIRIDKELRAKLLQEHYDEINSLYPKLDLIVGSQLRAKKQLSSDKLKKWLYSEMKMKARTKGGKLKADEDAIRSVMAEAESEMQKAKTPEKRMRLQRVFLALKIILRIKAREKRISSYLEVEIDADDRMRCSETVGGTETARWSHSTTPWGTGTNVATIPRELRAMFIPDDGYEMAEFDLNRGESWVYSYLSLDPELIRIHSTFGDFHSETASAISTAFGDRHYSVEEIIKLYKSDDHFGYRIRFLGKKVNHASAYRMGPFRGAEVVNEEADDTGFTITVGQMRAAQKLWKQKYFMMPDWWDRIEQQLNKNRTLVTPFGRERVFYGFFGDELFKEATAYVPQSTSVDYLNLGLLRVFKELVQRGAYGLELLHQQHDSIVVQYKTEHRDEVVPEIIERLQSKLVINKHEISIPVDAGFGPNWRELKGWKPPIKLVA